MSKTRRKVISWILTVSMVFSLFIGMGITSNASPGVTTRTITLDIQGLDPITDTNGNEIQPDNGVYDCPSEGWSWDKTNGILTLNNADFRPVNQKAIVAFGDIKIDMKGESTLAPEHTGFVIYNSHSITFTGDGTLNVYNTASNNYNNMYYGIFARNITIASGTVNVDVHASSNIGTAFAGYGVYCTLRSGFMMTGGELNATAVTSALCSQLGSVWIAAANCKGSTTYYPGLVFSDGDLSPVHAATVSSDGTACMGEEAPAGGDTEANVAKTVKLKYDKGLKLEGELTPFEKAKDAEEYAYQDLDVTMTGYENTEYTTNMAWVEGNNPGSLDFTRPQGDKSAYIRVQPSVDAYPGTYTFMLSVTQNTIPERVYGKMVVSKWDWEGVSGGTIPLQENTAINGENINLSMLTGLNVQRGVIQKVIETSDPDNILTITESETNDYSNGVPYTYDIISTTGPKVAKAMVYVDSDYYKTIKYELSFEIGTKTQVDIAGVDVYGTYVSAEPEFSGNAIIPKGEAVCTAKTVGQENVTTECGELAYTYYTNTGTKEDSVWSAGTTAAPIDAGSYKLVVSVADDNEKYYGNSEDILFEITPAVAYVLPNSYEINVGDVLPDFGLTAVWTKNGDTLNFETDIPLEFSLATFDDAKTAVDKDTANTRAGKYYIVWDNNAAVTVTLKDGTGKAANYTPVKIGENGILTVVDKDAVDISNVAINGKPYDGEAVAPAGTPVCTKTEGGDDVTAECGTLEYKYCRNTGTTEAPVWPSGSETAPKDAGKYKLVVAVPATNTKYTGRCELPFEIAKLNAAVKPKNVSYKIGDIADPKLELEWSGLLGEETLGVQTTPEFELKNSRNEVVSLAQAKATEGTYTITWSNMGTPVFTDATGKAINYNVTPSATGTFTVVDKTAVTISGLEIKDKTYDGKAVAPAGTAVAKLTATPNMDVTSECGTLEYKYCRNTGTTETPVWSSGSETAPKDAGSYKLVISVDKDNDLYAGSGEIKFTINKAAATVKVKNANAKVGDAEAPTFGLEWGGLVGTETLGVQIPPAFELKNAGNEVVTAAQAIAAEGSYTITWTNMSTAVFKDGTGVTSNYTITPTGMATLTVIDKTTVNITGVTVTDKKQDGTAIAPAGTPVLKRADETEVTDITTDLIYTYYLNDGTTKTSDSNSGAASAGAAPVYAGNYKLVISISDTDSKYMGKSEEIGFKIDLPMQEEKDGKLTAAAISFTEENPGGDKIVVIGHESGLKVDNIDQITINGPGNDNVLLKSGTDYTMKNTESVSITLTEAFLKTLDSGDYTLQATAKNGNFAGLVANIGINVVNKKSGGGGGSTTYFALSFDVDGGTTINKVSKATGSTVKLDAFASTKEGYVFDGWFIDKELKTKADSVKVNADMTVYAGWKAEGEVVTDGSCKHDSSCVAYKFGDLDLSKWYHDGIHYCVENGLMNGTTGTTFAPNLNTTRGMIVTIIYRMEKSPTVTGDCPFEDVKAGAYYEDAITWAAENKIVTGYDNDTFGPEDSITREQMAAIMYRYAEFKGYDVTGKADLSKYADSNAISAYAETAMSWANANALIKGKDGNVLDPTNNAIRCEAAAILQRFCEGVVK